ncbi:MAG: VWA domain-containing protein [Planctomycetota bacterium]|nr:VWA domain-containing protein [Planctomycetota bacterium]
MKRISMVGVVASTSGAILAASTVILSAGLAVANPNPGLDGKGPLGAVDRSDLDLPVMVPVYDPNPKPKPSHTIPGDFMPPPPRDFPLPPRPDGGDPRDEPPPVFFGEEIDSNTNSIIYVIDNSGSMTLSVEPFTDETGEVVRNGNRLDRAKAELRRSISSLPDTFFFNVIFYDECTLSCWSNKQRATSANKQYAFSWIAGVQPAGWTNTGMAVSQALRDKDNRSIVLLSDGSPNFLDCAMHYVGTFDQHRDLIRNENTQGATINAFGIGIASDIDARSFMLAVAADNRGSYVEVR